MSNLRVGCSPLTGTIFCGKVLKSGGWGKNKEDVTLDCLVAVAEHLKHFKAQTGKDTILDGGPNRRYKIIVEELDITPKEAE